MRGFDRPPAKGRRTILAALIVAAGVTAAGATAASAQDAGQAGAPAQVPPTEEQPAPEQPPQEQPPDPEEPAPGEAPADQGAKPNPFMFDSDAGMLTFFIKADKAADFEKVMAKLHQALANSDKPQRRQMAEGWKLYKAAEPGPNNTVLYVNFITPVLKGGDYTISKILAEVFPQEVQEIFPLYRDAFAGLSRAELELIEDFSAPFTPNPEAPTGEPATPAGEPPPADPQTPATPATPQ